MAGHVMQELIANGAKVTLGAFLLLLAALVAARGLDRRAKGPLALFLALVSANYLLDGAARFVTAADVGLWMLHASALAAILDPPALLLFAAAVTGRGPSGRERWLVMTPGLALAALYLATPLKPSFLRSWELAWLYQAHVALLYGAAFLLLVGSFAREGRPAQRDRLGALLVTFGTVVVSRFPLLVHEGVSAYATRPWFPPPGTPAGHALVLEAGLAAAAGAALLLLRARTAPGDRGAREVGSALVKALAVVGLGWLLWLLPPLRPVVFPLLYAGRWFLFAVLFVSAVRKHDILDLDRATERRLRLGFGAASMALAALAVGALVAGMADASAPVALAAGVAVVAVGGGIRALVRHAAPPVDAETSWRRVSAYRAYVELGVPARELEEVRVRLGLGAEEARQIRALADVERGAGRARAAGPEEGALFLGRYQVERRLGSGAFGRTFLALDLVRSERVVLKEMLAAWREDDEALARFRREAEVALRCPHPNLVAFRAIEPMGGGHVLVLEYVEGETLRERLARGGLLPPAEAATLAHDVLSGLGALHRAGVLHRDVKPENVVLRPDGRAVVLDLGAATSAAGRTREARGHPGTPGYMSPEQARGGELGPASDLYAVGVLLWEALTGRAPPQGEVPGAWAAPLRRALAPAPAQRWGSAERFLEAIPRGRVGALRAEREA